MDSRKTDFKLSVVVPVYNEQEVLELFYARMSSVLRSMRCDHELIMVDDGSRDDTWTIVQTIATRDKHVKGLRFARNFGHQTAVTAGMDAATGDALIIIDSDLQDPPEIIPEMVSKWREGFDVVYGKRLKRKGETVIKKLTAFLYYRLLKAMSANAIPLDTGDFRLIDRRVADVMGSMREHNRFLRGMSAWAGFKQCPVEYVRNERAAGKTKYTLKKMFKLAADGILGYSSKPLTMAFTLGITVLALTGASMVALLVYQIIKGFALIPWVLALLFIVGGAVLASLGIVGAYIARIYDEVKGRPIYIVSERSNFTPVSLKKAAPRHNRKKGAEAQPPTQAGQKELQIKEPQMKEPQIKEPRSEAQAAVQAQTPTQKTDTQPQAKKRNRRRKNKGRSTVQNCETARTPAEAEKTTELTAKSPTERTAAKGTPKEAPRRETPKESGSGNSEEIERERRAAAASMEFCSSISGAESRSELTDKWLTDRADKRNPQNKYNTKTNQQQ